MSEQYKTSKLEKKTVIFLIAFISVLIISVSSVYFFTQSSQYFHNESNNCLYESESSSSGKYIDEGGNRYIFEIKEETPSIAVYQKDSCGNYTKQYAYNFERIVNYPPDFKLRFLDQLFDHYQSNSSQLHKLNNFLQDISIQKEQDTFYTKYKVNNQIIEFISNPEDLSNIEIFINSKKIEAAAVLDHAIQNTANAKYIYFTTIDLFPALDRILIYGDVIDTLYRLNINSGEIEEVNTGELDLDSFSRLHPNDKYIFISGNGFFLDVLDLDGNFLQTINLSNYIETHVVEEGKGHSHGNFVNILYLDENIIVFNGAEFSSEIVILSIDELLQK